MNDSTLDNTLFFLNLAIPALSGWIGIYYSIHPVRVESRWKVLNSALLLSQFVLLLFLLVQQSNLQGIKDKRKDDNIISQQKTLNDSVKSGIVKGRQEDLDIIARAFKSQNINFDSLKLSLSGIYKKIQPLPPLDYNPKKDSLSFAQSLKTINPELFQTVMLNKGADAYKDENAYNRALANFKDQFKKIESELVKQQDNPFLFRKEQLFKLWQCYLSDLQSRVGIDLRISIKPDLVVVGNNFRFINEEHMFVIQDYLKMNKSYLTAKELKSIGATKKQFTCLGIVFD
ncbi:MAG: hypothetical protein JWQ27_246 [Ferruginibacter sp.]|nr:hypothetical protein [Ferruginibacter sp.]